MSPPERPYLALRLANLTLEQLHRERRYWQAQDSDAEKSAARSYAQERLAEVETELASRTPVVGD